MKVINIALRRPDGKVENDTVYAEKSLTMEDVKEISVRFDCDVLISEVGTVAFHPEEEIKEKTLVYEKPKKEVTENGTGEETKTE